MGQEGDYPWDPCEGGSACGCFQPLPAPVIPAPSQGVSRACPSLRFHLLLALDEAMSLWGYGVGWQPLTPGGSQFQGRQIPGGTHMAPALPTPTD